MTVDELIVALTALRDGGHGGLTVATEATGYYPGDYVPVGTPAVKSGRLWHDANTDDVIVTKMVVV